MLCSFSWHELIEHWQTVTTPNNEMECVKEILPPPTLVSHAFKFYMEYMELLTGCSSLTSFRGLICIYWMEMVHCDLKSVNCLVDKHLTIKICDFGLSWILTTTPMRDISSAGTPEWMAQELIWNEPFTEKCDIFSLGVLIALLLGHEKVIYAVANDGLQLEIPECPFGKLIAVPPLCICMHAISFDLNWSLKTTQCLDFNIIRRQRNFQITQ